MKLFYEDFSQSALIIDILKIQFYNVLLQYCSKILISIDMQNNFLNNLKNEFFEKIDILIIKTKFPSVIQLILNRVLQNCKTKMQYILQLCHFVLQASR